MSAHRLLVVDDDRSVREFLGILLEREGYTVRSVESGEDALVLLKSEPYDLVLSDLNMPGISGIELLEESRRLIPDQLFIMITAYATAETAVTAMREGAYDYITKPFKVEELKLTISRALHTHNLARENLDLRRQIQSVYAFDSIIGSSEPMTQLFEMMHRVKDTPITVLVCGETGTGKELVARALHVNGLRAERPFTAVNCGAIPEELMESELFGHVRGSFTGAHRDKLGLFQAADGGTLFLDEVGELSLSMQVKLLRALQSKRVKPVGGVEEQQVDVRIIAATNRVLLEEVQRGNFREDLYYRLNVVQLELPPLRTRREDFRPLMRLFIDRANESYGKQVRGVDNATLAMLMAHDFPGNVRELENLMERCVALAQDDLIRPELLPERLRNESAMPVPEPGLLIPEEGTNLDRLLEKFEHAYLQQALSLTGGRKKAAAELLGITFRSFRYRLAKHEEDSEES